jgi:transitional endoplasmic reticulum ATPase
MATEKTKNAEVLAPETVVIERTGKVITLPVGMSFNDGIKWLKRMRDESEQIICVERTFSIFPSEGAIALHAVLAERYGWVKATSIPPASFFESVQKPKLIPVEVGVGRVEQIPFGRFLIPNIDGWVQSGIALEGGLPCFQVIAEVQNSYVPEVNAILDAITKVASIETPYRGQAIRLPIINPDEKHALADYFPKFLDVRSASVDQMVFSRPIEELLSDNVFGPVMRSEQFRTARIPLKMGVLLEGQYGCGKTLVANSLAKVCTENGWTYILCENPGDLARCVQVARRFQPCVVFCEDIDRGASGSRRTEAIDRLLNVIDGIESKNTEIMIVLTTNHADQLSPAMRRPGRLDVVVPIGPPDAEAARRMISLYAGELLDPDGDFKEVSELLDGKTPAVVREVVERAKRSSIMLNDAGKDIQRITAKALARAARGMEHHLALLDSDPVDPPHPVDNLAEAVRDIARSNTPA